MILKLLIDFYHWLWGVPAFDTTQQMMSCFMFFGAVLDVFALVGIIGITITAIQDR